MSIRAAAPKLCLAVVHGVGEGCRRFAAKGYCTIETTEEFADDWVLGVHKRQIGSSPEVVWFTIGWEGETLELVQISVVDGYHRGDFSVMTARAREVLSGFLLELDAFENDVDEAVLVFQDGCWRYDADLYEDIQASTLDNIVLPPGMAETIRDDVQQWLDSKELYEKHGIPWKRGMILVGPPGNGKTHMIKALANHFDFNVLYVRGFESEYQSDAYSISSVFDRARECEPAMLVLEDLDTLVNADNRSHFLNELDGFAKNSGILAIASANDPARLDPALVNRPSRFDRRYTFDLPGEEERTRYLSFFTSSLGAGLRLGKREAAALGKTTAGFSYAYLKELVLSSMMAWISSDRAGGFGATLELHVAPLLAQMEVDPEPTPTPPGGTDPEDEMRRMARRMRRAH